MKRYILAALLCGTVAAQAQPTPSSIVVSAPWLRATPKGAPVAGGYATITNKSSTPDTLVGASLAIAPTGEVHSMSMDHGVMHMERLAHGLTIAPGATVTLAPGGNHLMFLHPNAQLKVGQEIDGALAFAKAGNIPVTFAVAGMAAKSAPRQAPAGGTRPGMDMPEMDMPGMSGHSTH